MRCMSIICLLLLVGGMMGQASATAGQDMRDSLFLANEYISIIVNTGEENTGRFSVNTTGGDPDRIGDEEKPLIYGSADPWTSFTTIRVDGENFVFGGRTQKPAGRQGPFGKVIVPPQIVDGQAVQTVCQIGPVQVEQVLGFTRSSTTGLKDTARIAYRITNQDDVPHRVGMRLVLDTMLGANDGAPFRVHDQAVTTDSMYTRAEMPDFWQAFDSLSDPQVMAQGTLKGPDVTAPDRVFFTNWGVLAESLWDFDFQLGRDFTRKGEFELDSAIALFWDPVTLSPGESISRVTYYGLGGITIAPGRLSLGVTSPAVITRSSSGPTRFPIVAYIENTGEGEAREVVATLQLPAGLALVEGQKAVTKLGSLAVGDTAQVAWQVQLDEWTGEEYSYTVRVEAINSEPNQVQRSVRVATPARLQIKLQGPDRLTVENGSLQPVPFIIQAVISNVGETAAPWVRAAWAAPLGMEPASGESSVKFVGEVPAQSMRTVRWHIIPTGVASEKLPYSVKVESGVTQAYIVNHFISVPRLPRRAELVSDVGQKAIGVGDLFKVTVKGINLTQVQEGRVVLRYPVQQLQVVGGELGVDMGEIFLPATTRDSTPREIHIDKKLGRIEVNMKNPSQPSTGPVTGSLCAVRFRATGSGTGEISLESVRLRTVDGKIIELEPEKLVVEVKG